MRVHGLRCSKVSTSYSALIPSRSGVLTLRSAGLYRYQHVEVDSSLFVSERISDVKCRKLHHYSIIPFLLSLSVYSELTAIKTFTSRNLAQSLHVCKPWCKRLLVWYPLARLHGLKQKYFQHCDVTNCPTPCIENIPNRDTTVSYRTEPWILWTVTPLISMHWLIKCCSKKIIIINCNQIICSCDQLWKLVAKERPVGRMSLEPCSINVAVTFDQFNAVLIQSFKNPKALFNNGTIVHI